MPEPRSLVESWKPVAGMEGRYEVSDHGAVRSLIAHGGARVLKPTPHVRTGHMILGLAPQPGIRKGVYVHQLVLEAFVGPRPEGHEALHADGDPSNNRLSNLRWGTRSENLLDAVKHGTHQGARKTHCPRGHAYDREYYRRSGPKAGQSFRACSQCDVVRGRKRSG